MHGTTGGAIILLFTECQIKNTYKIVEVPSPANYSLEISESVLMSGSILKTKCLSILRGRMRNLERKRKKIHEGEYRQIDKCNLVITPWPIPWKVAHLQRWKIFLLLNSITCVCVCLCMCVCMCVQPSDFLHKHTQQSHRNLVFGTWKTNEGVLFLFFCCNSLPRFYHPFCPLSFCPLFIFEVLRIEPRASHMPGKAFNTELYPKLLIDSFLELHEAFLEFHESKEGLLLW